MRYAEIILPVPGPCYTFAVEGEMERMIAVGCAVKVQFGPRKIVGGIVRALTDRPPAYKKLKPVLELLFPRPIVPESQLGLWEWMAEYYMCSPGEVMRAALPSLLKPSGLSDEEFAADTFRKRRMKVVRLAANIAEEHKFDEICERLSRRAPKQHEALMEIAKADGGTARSDLKADPAALAALQKKGIIEITEHDAAEFSPETSAAKHSPGMASTEISPGMTPIAGFRLPELSPAQKTALDETGRQFGSKEVVLLFGVAASGKSEVAFHAIARTLASGRDVLMLLPEISLTTQFVKRVRSVFGDRVVLYHSGLTDRRRAEAYIRLTGDGGPFLVIGTRSAVFLPLCETGLVVVDEEQDPGYKQRDPAPRYNARDAAIVMARSKGAKVLLQSATPSLETWANATGGKYGLVRLDERFGDSKPPLVVISDTLRSVVRGERKSHFNKELSDRIGEALAQKSQVILFQNRRGVAAVFRCSECGRTHVCPRCGVPMVAHKKGLKCHCCGRGEPLPEVCPACGGAMTTGGFGTEKIEDELAVLFPGARIARLDGDSAGSEKAYNRIIGGFERGETDILVGTQIVTKGLDFEGVSLVGILNADNLVDHPDFRASERAYQLIGQVIGRAGRRDRQGTVVVQTAKPDNRLLALAAAGDYATMAAEMLSERAEYGYPPYSRLISITLRCGDSAILETAAMRLDEILRPIFGDALMGPQPPVNGRAKGEFALVFLLKVPRGRPLSEAREAIRKAIRRICSEPVFRTVTITPNVDPLD